MIRLPSTLVAAARWLATAAVESQPPRYHLTHLPTSLLVRHVVERCWSSPLELHEAHHLFDEMSSAWPRPYTRYFSLLRSKTLHSGYPLAALSFHSRMVHAAGVLPDRYAFGISIRCCNHFGAVDLALGFFSDMLKRCCEVDTVVFCGLIDGLCAEGRISDALEAFERMPEMGCIPDGVLYGRLVGWSCQLRGAELGEGLFCCMLKHAQCADAVVVTILMDGLCCEGRRRDAVKVFERMTEMGCAPDEVSYGILVECFCDLGLMDEAMGFVCRMLKEGYQCNVVVFTTLMDGLCDLSGIVDALEFFRGMLKMECLLDVVMYGVLISKVCLVGRVDMGLALFSDMLRRGIQPNTVVLTSLVDGFCKMRWIHDAVVLFKRMPEMGIAANEITYGSLISCFFSLGFLKLGLGYFCDLQKRGHHLDKVVLTSLIHGNLKALRTDDATFIFKMMPEMDCAPDVVTYGVLIDFCFHLGNAGLGFGLFCNMLKEGVHAYTPILNILVHGICLVDGLIDATEFIERLKNMGYFPNVITHGILIKFLCQNQGVDKAIELLNEMAKSGNHCHPNVVTYMTIISRLIKESKMDKALKLLKEMDDRVYWNHQGVASSYYIPCCWKLYFMKHYWNF